jgi:hypothetical protein
LLGSYPVSYEIWAGILLQCLFMAEIIHKGAPLGLPPPVMLESHHMTYTMLVQQKDLIKCKDF